VLAVADRSQVCSSLQKLDVHARGQVHSTIIPNGFLSAFDLCSPCHIGELLQHMGRWLPACLLLASAASLNRAESLSFGRSKHTCLPKGSPGDCFGQPGNSTEPSHGSSEARAAVSHHTGYGNIFGASSTPISGNPDHASSAAGVDKSVQHGYSDSDSDGSSSGEPSILESALQMGRVYVPQREIRSVSAVPCSSAKIQCLCSYAL
jgi:hypothetical protein